MLEISEKGPVKYSKVKSSVTHSDVLFSPNNNPKTEGIQFTFTHDMEKQMEGTTFFFFCL